MPDMFGLPTIGDTIDAAEEHPVGCVLWMIFAVMIMLVIVGWSIWSSFHR